ncbi:hypothetical protein PGTUg99_004664 [Puccinia graminis f. sp. tritici]|uniref:Secreted protein n=1 Tax=Puccinia graminis f. sp. tritici TaxID=56615 RepID=A0A5B0R8K7_PUCGR|nr:hypothetical protein PGTUg99_004664 [Puccinia graminis f. sp. tritici]
MLQRFHITSAVIVMTLLSSVQLSASRRHSLVRRGPGYETVSCDKSFSLDPSGDVHCRTNDNKLFKCSFGDCPTGHAFQLHGCQAYTAPKAELNGIWQDIYPYGYYYNTATPTLLLADDRDGNNYGCALDQNINHRHGEHTKISKVKQDPPN